MGFRMFAKGRLGWDFTGLVYGAAGINAVVSMGQGAVTAPKKFTAENDHLQVYAGDVAGHFAMNPVRLAKWGLNAAFGGDAEAQTASLSDTAQFSTFRNSQTGELELSAIDGKTGAVTNFGVVPAELQKDVAALNGATVADLKAVLEAPEVSVPAAEQAHTAEA